MQEREKKIDEINQVFVRSVRVVVHGFRRKLRDVVYIYSLEHL